LKEKNARRRPSHNGCLTARASCLSSPGAGEAAEAILGPSGCMGGGVEGSEPGEGADSAESGVTRHDCPLRPPPKPAHVRPTHKLPSSVSWIYCRFVHVPVKNNIKTRPGLNIFLSSEVLQVLLRWCSTRRIDASTTLRLELCP